MDMMEVTTEETTEPDTTQVEDISDVVSPPTSLDLPPIGYSLVARKATEKHRHAQCWQPNIAAARVSARRLTGEGFIEVVIVAGIIPRDADLPVQGQQW